jgi:hypothetical protein
VRPKWFPWAPRLRPENWPKDFVLVTLHQPCLDWEANDWRNLIEYCASAVPPSFTLVIRPHPTEAPQPISAELCQRLLARGVMISDPGALPGLGDLVERCRAVFTLTSATGFQALLRGRMVFTLAAAFYCRAGLARRVGMQDTTAFADWLAEGAPGPDHVMVAAFDRWLRASCILPYPTADASSLTELRRRLFSVNHD